jgi:hypothetical protein
MWILVGFLVVAGGSFVILSNSENLMLRAIFKHGSAR